MSLESSHNIIVQPAVRRMTLRIVEFRILFWVRFLFSQFSVRKYVGGRLIQFSPIWLCLAFEILQIFKCAFWFWFHGIVLSFRFTFGVSDWSALGPPNHWR